MGKIEFDHTGSGSGITLSSDGTDLLLNGTAIGGGGAALELYAENPVTPTAPSATGTNAVAIGTGAVSSGSTSVAIGDRTEATANQTVAIGSLNTRCSSIQGVAIGSARASGLLGSVAIGGYGSGYSVASNNYSIAIGRSYSSGDASFAAAITNNTSSYGATGANSVAIGYQAKATGQGSFSTGYQNTSQGFASAAIGWSNSITAAGSSSVALGYNNTVSGSYASALGGHSNSVTAGYAVATGYRAKADVHGKVAHSAGYFSSVGDAQSGKFVLRSDTTNATPEALTGDNFSGTTQVILPNNSAYAFHGTIVARQQASAGTACAAWKIEGLIRREGSAGTTVLVNSATTVIDNTPGWGMALSADTTNGGLAITVTGAAATNIRWVATVHTSEVTY